MATTFAAAGNAASGDDLIERLVESGRHFDVDYDLCKGERVKSWLSIESLGSAFQAGD
jgi:hypothetical protein